MVGTGVRTGGTGADGWGEPKDESVFCRVV